MASRPGHCLCGVCTFPVLAFSPVTQVSSHDPKMCRRGKWRVYTVQSGGVSCGCECGLRVWVRVRVVGAGADGPAREGHPVQGYFLPGALSCREKPQSPEILNWSKQVGKE